LLLELEEESLLMATFKNLKAHLMMEFNASEQIRAHNRTPSIITTFASNLGIPKYESVELWLFVKTGEPVSDR
jgi:hypothetical protein